MLRKSLPTGPCKNCSAIWLGEERQIPYIVRYRVCNGPDASESIVSFGISGYPASAIRLCAIRILLSAIISFRQRSVDGLLTVS